MKIFKLLLSVLVLVASVMTGGGVVMADAVITTMPEGGATITAGDGSRAAEGALTLQDGEEASPDLFMEDVDKRITKIRPMSTPIDQISRKAGRATKTDSLEVKYYSVATRPLKGKVKTAVTTSTTADRFALELYDPSMLDIGDTLRFVGINGYKEDFTTVDTGVDFVGLVIDIDSNGKFVIQPINGGGGATANVGYPAIAKDAQIIRMGRAGAELDVTTSVFSNVPTPDTQYCQKFIMQVEESTWARMSKKEVEWNFSDLEEDGIYDMKMGMEGSYLFGVKRKFKNAKTKQLTYTTGGIYYMVGKKIDVGTYDATKQATIINDEQLVDIAKELFTGTGVGNKRKVALAGSDALAAFSKIKSNTDRYTVRENVEVWDMKFKSFDTDFGELLFIHDEMLDMQGKSDEVVVIDPEFLTKRYFKGWSRDSYNMKDLALRDTQAVVLSEVSCLYLRLKNAHAILKLSAIAPVAVTGVTLDKATLSVAAAASAAALVATVAPTGATNKDVVWITSDATKATVDQDGVVTGVAQGSAVITVATVDGGFTDTCAVTVTA